MSITLDDHRHWRDRADETRAIARDTKDYKIKRIMQDIAYDYDRLAWRIAAARRTDGGGPATPSCAANDA
jgi:hypothetical protein